MPESTSLTAWASHEADRVVVTLEGEMDLTATTAFRAQVLQPLLAGPQRPVLVDCSRLEFVALLGVDLLVELAVAVGTRVTLLDPPISLVRLLEFTGSAGRFELAPGVALAPAPS